MFFLFSPQTLEEKQTRQTNPNFIVLAQLFFLCLFICLFFSNGHTRIGSRFVPFLPKWASNECGEMKMKSYWKWKPLYYFASAFDNLSPDVQNFRQEGLAFCNSISLPFLFLFFFSFFNLRWMVSRRQWRNSIFICLLLFGFHRKGRWAFMCLILPQRRFSSSF